MTFYEYLEEAVQQKGFKDMTEFCMKAGISAYLQERFKYNATLRSDTKAKIAGALRTCIGDVNQLVSMAQADMAAEDKNVKTTARPVQPEAKEPAMKKSKKEKLTAKEVAVKKIFKEIIQIPNNVEEAEASVAEPIVETVDEEPVTEIVEESTSEQADENVVEKIECEVEEMEEKNENVGVEEVAKDSLAEQFKESWLKLDKDENKDNVKKQERNAANLEFVYSNINVYREVRDAFYLRQAQVYLSKMIEDAE